MLLNPYKLMNNNNDQNNELKEQLKKYVSEIFYKNISNLDENIKQSDKKIINKSNVLDNNMSKINTLKSINNDNNFCIFNQAPELGLWYNWATDVGKKYCAISYSAGTTWMFNKFLPPTPPIIYIFEIKDIRCNNSEEVMPKFELRLSNEEANGIRSLLLIEDNVNEPYCLIGTFNYPSDTKLYKTKLLKWKFKLDKLDTIVKITKDNSIRQIIRYKKNKQDIIFFSTQNDSITYTKSKLYWIRTQDIKPDADVKNIKLIYSEEYITGSIWDFYIDCNTLYISIPKIIVDTNKLSGYKILARLFYFDIKKIFYKNSKHCIEIKKKIKTNCLIGNLKYPPGFNINSISTVQVITNPKSEYVYIYTLSDFLYQIAFIINNPNILNKIQTKFNLVGSNNILLDIILGLRNVILSFDIEGTRIFKFNKSDLFKKCDILISTVVGDSPYNTLNLSTTSNGFDSYTNLYTWCATSYRDDYYFGTLDLRSQIYNLIVLLISSILQIPGLYEFLVTLPQDQIIIITELFNPNFCIGGLENLRDKKLYFDIIKIESKTNYQNKITSSGFNTNNGLNQMSDDGVRNLNIIHNHDYDHDHDHDHDHDQHYLLIGTTCYQSTNVAKNYLIKIN